jgi:hypothetical protein
MVYGLRAFKDIGSMDLYFCQERVTAAGLA